ncbi:MAG: ATP-dependent helicase [Eubacterium sp.]|nr:ATP-dependent helicase [Eubacterium sp.]
MQLNKEQNRAADHRDGPMLVLAGPGTGKTAVITERCCRLVRRAGVSPDQILVVTFTRAAAAQMRGRIRNELGADAAGMSIGTFHGIFYGILRAECRLSSDSILGGPERRRLLEELVSHIARQAEQEADLPELTGREISYLKGSGMQLSHFYSTVLPADVFREIFRAYERWLADNGKIDFDDIILRCRTLLLKKPEVLNRWQRKFRYILVDEFQDIAPMQYEIIRMLAEPEQNLFIVGDDDQSIYRFRGASPELMLGFPKQYPDARTVSLNTNYRCSGSILTLSRQVIGRNRRRYDKQLHAVRDEGVPVSLQMFADPREESEWMVREIRQQIGSGIRPEEIAVLFRTNAGCRTLVEQLITEQVPFHTADHVPCIFDHWIAKQLLAYMELGAGSRKRSDFLMICNRPNRYFSRSAFAKENVSFPELYAFYRDRDWMCERIRKLEADLEMIGRMPPYGAIQYINLAVGYGNWLKEYAAEHQLAPEDLTDVLEELRESAKACPTLEAWKARMEAVRQQLNRRRDDSGVTVATLHASKGCEYRMVLIADINEGIIPWHKAVLEADLEEERRMLYVGMTRAKDRLYLCQVRKRFAKSLEPSRFLRGLIGKK